LGLLVNQCYSTQEAPLQFHTWNSSAIQIQIDLGEIKSHLLGIIGLRIIDAQLARHWVLFDGELRVRFKLGEHILERAAVGQEDVLVDIEEEGPLGRVQ